VNNIVMVVLVLLNLSSCSFQSSQYEIIKNLIKTDNVQGPKKNWKLTWNNKQTNLYAINVDKQIIFSDSNINIFYKDQQIYKITGLFGGDNLMEIGSSNSKLIYKLNGKNIASDSCVARNMIIGENEYKRYSHVCFEQKSGDSYENRIIINPKNLIVSLQFKVHPSYPLLELSME
jgi:hypothetical protein